MFDLSIVELVSCLIACILSIAIMVLLLCLVHRY